MAAAFSREQLLAFTLFLFPPLLSLSKLENVLVFFLFSHPLKWILSINPSGKGKSERWKKWGSGLKCKNPPLFKCISHCKCRKVCFWKYTYWLAQKWNFGKTFVEPEFFSFIWCLLWHFCNELLLLMSTPHLQRGVSDIHWRSCLVQSGHQAEVFFLELAQIPWAKLVHPCCPIL